MIAVINAVQVFEPVALITQGGPVKLDQCAHLSTSAASASSARRAGSARRWR